MTSDEVDRAVSLGSLSAKDRLVWQLETRTDVQPHLLMLFFLKEEVDEEALRAWHRKAVDHIPTMAAKTVCSRRPGARPRWEVVPSFDPALHIHRVRAPGEATETEVLALAESFSSTPFIPARPPWEGLVIDGLDRGRSAYVLKMSHTVADGLRLREMFLRQSAAAPMLPSVGHTTASGGRLAARGAPQGLVAAARRTRQAVLFGKNVIQDLRDPPSTPKGTGDGVERRYFTATLSMAALRARARAGGGTVQDALVAGLVEGCQRYNAHYGAERLRMRVFSPYGRAPARPHDTSPVGNHWFIIRFDVPSGPSDCADRIAASRAAINAVYNRNALDWMQGIARVAPFLPPSLLQYSFRLFTSSHDFIISNIPGPRATIRLAGAEVDHVYGIAPTLGAGVTVTTVSYRDTCHVMLNIDPVMVHDVGLFKDCLRAGLVDMARPAEKE
ncbi:wax ester/triacylglycerol synthase domain-containing protein [Streptomyces flaveolus]|uniref:wax ester/triacylglycerol synthase domain-containing protein n=1 Tax=Streptomyces flaveolus TaxID=67297 RepID=UPI0037957297